MRYLNSSMCSAACSREAACALFYITFVLQSHHPMLRENSRICVKACCTAALLLTQSPASCWSRVTLLLKGAQRTAASAVRHCCAVALLLKQSPATFPASRSPQTSSRRQHSWWLQQQRLRVRRKQPLLGASSRCWSFVAGRARQRGAWTPCGSCRCDHT
jgi:hypothetical protein